MRCTQLAATTTAAYTRWSKPSYTFALPTKSATCLRLYIVCVCCLAAVVTTADSPHFISSTFPERLSAATPHSQKNDDVIGVINKHIHTPPISLSLVSSKGSICLRPPTSLASSVVASQILAASESPRRKRGSSKRRQRQLPLG